MRYLGGKARLAKRIVPILKELRKPYQLFAEPFLGGCNILPHIDDPRIAGDANPSIAALWDAVAQGWEPPDFVSEDEYKAAKSMPDCALKGYIMTACTFNGIYGGGYARTAKSTGQNYQKNGYDSVMKTLPLISGVEVLATSYQTFPLLPGEPALVYCDPPYQGVAQYKGAPPFDHTDFWQWVRERSIEGHTVVVSEYQAPDDFTVIATFQSVITTGTQRQRKPRKPEYLFVYEG